VAKLPVDFDIFSSRQLDKPLCIQVLDEGLRVISIQDTLGLAISFS